MTQISLTRHAIMRAAQRGIANDDLDLVMLIGTEVEDGYFVRNKDCEAMERQLRRLADRVRHLKGKYVVVADAQIVTVYQAGRTKEQRLMRRAEQRNFVT